MAEGGIVEGVLSDDVQEPGSVDPEKTDPFAAAVAMEATRGDPEVARGVLSYLGDLRDLVRLQIRHFDEERRLAIGAAKRKRFADRIRAGMLVGVALVGLAVVGAVAGMVWDAFNARGVVVEALSVPPDLAERGLTGRALAAALQDQLNALQEDTASYTASRRAASEGGADLKVEIPETGVSLGEVRQSLREWLGHETRVAGEVYELKDASGAPALALTVRVGNDPGQRWIGTEAGMDALVRSAAEKIYASIAPFRFADWLSQHGREAEAVPVLARVATAGPASLRSEAELRLGDVDTLPFDQRLDHFRRAVRLDPQNAAAVASLADEEGGLGHAETALAGYVASERLPQSSDLSAAGRAIRQNQVRFALDSALGDFQGALQVAKSDAAYDRDDPSALGRQFAEIRSELLLHDSAPARRFIAGGYSPNPMMSPARNADREAGFDHLAALFDSEVGDWAGALSSWSKVEALSTRDSPVVLTSDTPRRALALAKLGRQAEAEALIATTPTDCYLCLRERGAIAAQKGDWSAAERWFAEAVRQAPSIPFAYQDWGQARLAKGDLAGAMVLFQKAQQAGPRWADPLKAWGDVLARQGQREAALARYDEALQLAPNWTSLRQARDAAGRSPH